MTESTYNRYNKSYYQRHKQERNDYSREYMRLIYYPAHRKEVMARVKDWRARKKAEKLKAQPENQKEKSKDNKNRGNAKR